MRSWRSTGEYSPSLVMRKGSESILYEGSPGSPLVSSVAPRAWGRLGVEVGGWVRGSLAGSPGGVSGGVHPVPGAAFCPPSLLPLPPSSSGWLHSRLPGGAGGVVGSGGGPIGFLPAGVWFFWLEAGPLPSHPPSPPPPLEGGWAPVVGVVVPPLAILQAVPGSPKGGCLLEGPSGRLPGAGRSGSAVGCASGPGCPVR